MNWLRKSNAAPQPLLEARKSAEYWSTRALGAEDDAKEERQNAAHHRRVAELQAEAIEVLNDQAEQHLARIHRLDGDHVNALRWATEETARADRETRRADALQAKVDRISAELAKFTTRIPKGQPGAGQYVKATDETAAT